ncbi:hypothetical protein GCM10027018_25510 [Paenibacillus thermoaerophilus]
MSRTAGDVENVGDASSAAVIGDDVYVLASRDESDANKIYKINLKTNKTEKIVNSSELVQDKTIRPCRVMV